MQIQSKSLLSAISLLSPGAHHCFKFSHTCLDNITSFVCVHLLSNLKKYYNSVGSLPQLETLVPNIVLIALHVVPWGLGLPVQLRDPPNFHGVRATLSLLSCPVNGYLV